MVDEVVIPVRIDAKKGFQALTQMASIVTRGSGRIGGLTSQVAGFSAILNSVKGPVGILAGGLLAVGSAATIVIGGIVKVNQAMLRMAASAVKLTIAITKDVVGAFISFDDALRGAQVLGEVKNIGKLREFILKLGGATRFTSTQIALLAQELAKAGAGEELQQRTLATVNLAQATRGELGPAMELVTAISKQFGKNGESLAEAIDQLSVLTVKTTFNLSGLSTAMTFAGTAATTVGADFTETAAVLGVLKDRFIQASKAGTRMQGFMLRLFAPSKAVKNALASVGLSAGAVDIKARGLFPVLETLTKSFTGNEKAIKLMVGALGLRAGPAFSAIIEDFAKADSEAKKFFQQMKDGKGSAERMANLLLNTLGGALVKLTSAWDNLKVTVGGFLDQTAGDAVATLSVLVGALQNVATEFQGPIIGAIQDGLKRLSEAVLGTSDVMEFLTGPRFVSGFANITNVLLEVGVAMSSVAGIGVAMAQILVKALSNIAGGFAVLLGVIGEVALATARLSASLLGIESDTLFEAARAAKRGAEATKAFSDSFESLGDSKGFEIAQRGIDKLRRAAEAARREASGIQFARAAQETLFEPAAAALEAKRKEGVVRPGAEMEINFTGLEALPEELKQTLKNTVSEHFARVAGGALGAAINPIGIGSSISQAGTGTAISGAD